MKKLGEYSGVYGVGNTEGPVHGAGGLRKALSRGRKDAEGEHEALESGGM